MGFQIVTLLFLFQIIFAVNDAKIITYNITKMINLYLRHANVHTHCEKQILLVSEHFQKMSMWALKMVDASSKIQSGILMGNLVDLGNVDECLAIDVPELDIHGKHCTMGLGKNGFDFLVALKAVCVPATCSTRDVSSIFNLWLSPHNFTITIPDNYCRSTAVIAWPYVTYIVIASTSTYLLWIFFCTLVSLSDSNCKSSIVIQSFSFYCNWKKLTTTKKVSNKAVIKSLNGIRVLSTAGIIFGHEFLLRTIVPLNINNLEIFDFFHSYSGSIIIGTINVIDTFLVITGVLVTTGVMTYLDLLDGKIPWILVFIHRIIRISVALIVILVFNLTIVKYLYLGPIWDIESEYVIEPCEKYWWSYLLFIQNYVNPTELCLPHTWYLSVDMQLFLICPFVLYLLWKIKYRAIYLTTLTILSTIPIICVVYIKELYEFGLVKKDILSIDEGKKWLQYYYFPTYSRLYAWLIGISVGYFLYSKQKIKLKKLWQILLWIVTFMVLLSLYVSMVPIINRNQTNVDLQFNRLYMVLSRLAWPLSIAWIIIACHLNYGGPINTFLSQRFWTPLCRISYTMYMVHMTLIEIRVCSQYSTTEFSFLNWIYAFLADYMATIFTSIVVYLVFERPIFNLEEHLLQKGKNWSNQEILTMNLVSFIKIKKPSSKMTPIRINNQSIQFDLSDPG